MLSAKPHEKKEIPIFFSTDDNYIPFLDVAIRSLIKHASKAYRYRMIVLNTGIKKENAELVKQSENENTRIDFIDISDNVEDIKAHFRNIYHFSVATYYRIFIASLFPEYDKVIYLDCDLVVLDDISKLYEVELGENILGGAREEFIFSTHEFRLYAKEAVGVDPENYINAGVLLMNLAGYRKNRIEEQFVDLITRYNFDTVDPDQAYLNFLCRGKIKMLPSSWNREPIGDVESEEPCVMHYALYKKPWQYDGVLGEAYFWKFAEESPFYKEILKRKESFDEAAMRKSQAAAKEIKEHALRIVAAKNSFKQTLFCGVMGGR